MSAREWTGAFCDGKDDGLEDEDRMNMWAPSVDFDLPPARRR